MHLEDQYLIFTLDTKRYAMGLTCIQKVIRAVAIHSLPEGQDILLGLLNMQGTIIPVIDIRRHFSLPSRELDLGDRIIISHASGLSIAFVADTVEGVVEIPENHVDKAQTIFPNLDHVIDGVGKLKDNTVLIYSLDNLLSTRDIDTLRTAIETYH